MDPDQLASQKQGDKELHCCQNVYGVSQHGKGKFGDWRTSLFETEFLGKLFDCFLICSLLA